MQRAVPRADHDEDDDGTLHHGDADEIANLLLTEGVQLLVHVSLSADVQRGSAAAAQLADMLASAGAIEALDAVLRGDGLSVATCESACRVLLFICGGGRASSSQDDAPVLAAHGGRAARAGLAARLRGFAPMFTQYAPETRDRLVLLSEALDGVTLHACDGCGAKDTPELKRCARCRAVRYCSAACQRQAWPTHKQDCVAA
jgi:hypothetical protein